MRLKVPASKLTWGVAGMLKKYASKFAMDILPSVVATIIGAYIVNHYIVAKPADVPAASAASKATPEPAKTEAKASDPINGAVSGRGPGVKAKGISEKAILEKSTAEKAQEKSGDSAPDKPAETAVIPVETRRHQPAPREKTFARTVPAPAPAAAPAISAPATVPPAEAASAPEERRDANDLARAAIERLRGSNEVSPRPQEAARSTEPARVPEAVHLPDAARIPDAPRVVSAPAIRPLPPPILVSTPPVESRVDDPSRPTPPAEIPSRPLDLRAETAGPAARERTTVAEDMLSAAKSVFHAVLPK
jgi:hypothetical protein